MEGAMGGSKMHARRSKGEQNSGVSVPGSLLVCVCMVLVERRDHTRTLSYGLLSSSTHRNSAGYIQGRLYVRSHRPSCIQAHECVESSIYPRVRHLRRVTHATLDWQIETQTVNIRIKYHEISLVRVVGMLYTGSDHTRSDIQRTCRYAGK